jgi:hypothetical protein
MILYSENQLDEAWQYDCKKRSADGRHWIARSDYEKLFVLYLDNMVSGEELIKLDIYIPQDMLDSIDEVIELETGYTDD